jgi:hypothetical protein
MAFPLTHIIVTINNGQSESAVIDCGNEVFVGYYGPIGWTSAALRFDVSYDGVTFYKTGLFYSPTIDGYTYILPKDNAFYGIRYIKVQSEDGGGTPVNQGATRTFRFVTRPW